MISPAFWWQAIKLALSQIHANLGRSLLTALGIIVGVASVTAVIAALGGLKDRVLTEFETFGANRLLVFPIDPTTPHGTSTRGRTSGSRSPRSMRSPSTVRP